jgi:uncharacterized membrane protein
MNFILILYVALGLLSAAFAVPLMLRKVGPNPVYGFRVRKTLEDPALWYDANAFAGKCLFWFGVGTGLACVALYFVPIDPVAYAWACLVISLGGLAMSVILSFRFLNRLLRVRRPG